MRTSSCGIQLLTAAILSLTMLQTAHPFLMWKAEREDKIIHVLAKVDFLSPDEQAIIAEELRDAFESSDVVVFETTTDPNERKKISGKVARAARYPRGDNLLEHLPQDIADAFTSVCEQYDINMARIAQVKPWAASYNLNRITTQKAGVEHIDFLDKHFTQLAKAKDIASDYLIKPAEFVALFKNLPEATQIELLKKTLEEAKQKKVMLAKTAEAWQAGAADSAEAIMREGYQAYRDVRRAVADKLSENWAGKLHAMTRFDERIFVIIPLDQTVGAEGVLEKLKAEGYSIEQITKD